MFWQDYHYYEDEAPACPDYHPMHQPNAEYSYYGEESPDGCSNFTVNPDSLTIWVALDKLKEVSIPIPPSLQDLQEAVTKIGRESLPPSLKKCLDGKPINMKFYDPEYDQEIAIVEDTDFA